MQRGNLDDLSAFLIVAREGSFTKAAARLGVSQSALSYTIKQLEACLMLRLLTRTTRSVSPTAAGERLLRHVGPRPEEIETELAALSELREKPSGTVRITATENATASSCCPSLPSSCVSTRTSRSSHQRLRPDRYRHAAFRCRRAGWRTGRQGHDCGTDRARLAHGGRRRSLLFPKPAGTEEAAGIGRAQFINLRLPTHGGLYAWEFEKGSRKLKVRSKAN
jgi:DNA-binding transcriptional LysR family regulator